MRQSDNSGILPDGDSVTTIRGRITVMGLTGPTVQEVRTMTMTQTTNRVLAHAERVRATINTGTKPDGSPVGDLGELDKTLALSAADFFGYQTAQAKAHATGLLSTDEAMTVYHALGGEIGGSPANGGWTAGVDLALKVTITSLIRELIGAGR